MLRQRFGDEAYKYIDVDAELARAMPTFISIDEALHFHSGNPKLVQLGKSEIVRQIIRSKASSALKGTGRAAPENVRETWFPEFLSMALAGLKKSELESAFENVTIINFNYDRTLDQQLFWALQTTAGVNANIAAQVIAKLNVIRPYGSVGGLDWQQGRSVRFGDSNRESRCSLRLGRLVHPAGFDVRPPRPALEPGDLVALRRNYSPQFGHFFKQLQHQALQIARRKIIKVCRRRHSHKESDSCTLGNLIIVPPPRVLPLLLFVSVAPWKD
jgi:hypothetical protein